ncbi:glycosyltransferase family 1 protein [Bacillus pseudomycoides]|uniref:Glycosyltransferase family 1 protein n=1 Tax=Bacillus pseudomycoides TaxID=64104 RepID=A0AA91VB17_9BACI|nr:MULTISPECIES: glycosyltransferase family 4 protein [Bacillus]PEB56281.1 glycosyltransferase family 1 protein [Bacillus sp. AFS098217]PED81711.1 glycosyltransferase family 1 protein [Bacillus pseudomycoides]PEU09360.1 glycosyltransferase family 1 protein [Bacillus sp. AFS014408]PEU10639.1 glycosyltransferase family 1 protein [Bacillus sp. AFS019443]PFW64254.1 glycosyltransferase family 1 protein [Bacillus sp. AFS075034]
MKTALIVTTVSSTISAFLIPSIKLLISKGYKVEIATNIQNENFVKVLGDEIVVHHVSFSRSVKSFENVKAYFQIKKLLRKNTYSFIHTHTPIASLLTRLVSKYKVVYTAHGFHFNENGSSVSNLVYKIAEKIGAKKTDRLIVINKDDYEASKQIISPDKVRFIKGIGVDMKEYDPEIIDYMTKMELKKELGISESTKIITHIAEFNDNKRHIDIVHAAEKLREIYGNDFVILLLGRGPNVDFICNKIRELNLDYNVQYLGYRKDINRILSITDVGSLVSLREGLPRSVLEMMSMQVPVVVTNIRGNRDLIQDGYNGFLVDVRAPEQIANRCYEILTNSELAEKFRINSYEKIIEGYSLERVLEELEKVYQELE